jgi:hypothetical protein
MRGRGILGSILATLVLPVLAHAQAVDLAGALDLDIAARSDRDRYGPTDPISITVTVRNLTARERYVERRLVDLDHLELRGAGAEFRLASRLGGRAPTILERLDPHGGAKDRLIEVYTLPACCSVFAGSDRLDRLPPGTYTLTYAAAGLTAQGGEGGLRSEASTFTIAPASEATTNRAEGGP